MWDPQSDRWRPPHGLCMTQAGVVNQELLAFLQN